MVLIVADYSKFLCHRKPERSFFYNNLIIRFSKALAKRGYLYSSVDSSLNFKE